LSFKTYLTTAHHFHTAKFINAPGLLLMGRHTVTFIMASHTYKSGHQSIINNQSLTDNATYKLTTEIPNAMNNKLLVGGIFCDLEKTFEYINRNILLTKLKFYGMVGNINKYQYHYQCQGKLNDTDHLIVATYISRSGPVRKLVIQELNGKDLIPRR
jgi:hypothetical protein